MIPFEQIAILACVAVVLKIRDIPTRKALVIT